MKKTELKNMIQEEILKEMAVEDFKRNFLSNSIDVRKQILKNLETHKEYKNIDYKELIKWAKENLNSKRI